MAKNTIDVIADALRDINVISEVDTPDANQGAYGVRKLNEMMALWRETDKDVGYFPQADSTGVCPIPDYAELAVTTSLSVVLAPKYGASVSAELVAVVSASVEALQIKLMQEKIDNQDMSHMPAGQGHRGAGRWDINTDW
jgi:hypothetical protein